MPTSNPKIIPIMRGRLVLVAERYGRPRRRRRPSGSHPR
jgi:hypothetical protein